MKKGFLGEGWSFPLHVDGRGGMATARGATDIEQAIRVILGTAQGERPMRPDFGCRIHELIFSPINTTTTGMAVHYVEEALGWWEPRIDVTEVSVLPDDEDPARLLINIRYQVKATHDDRSLVFPFYVIPEE
ncbi:MAG: GPW/gp25 family protein [Anaerolineae bacterium]